MANEDEDYNYALALQSQFNDENVEPEPKKSRKSSFNELDMTKNLVNPEWELVDPTPDVNSMFSRFDDKFFHKKLQCVQLEWSKKMYNCAGICYSRSNRFGQAVTIRLSEPLLKLRPRKDLVETLLHEMIHAYCFVMGIREGNGGHGPNFVRIMQDINKVAGTNITVYHTFHDEVNVYKRHIWRCNGICQHRRPFFGYVKRTMNRPPGPTDNWWRAHKEACGGYFNKVSEPEKTTKKREKKEKKPKTSDENPNKSKSIKDFFVPSSSNSMLLPPSTKQITSTKHVASTNPISSSKTSTPAKIVTIGDLEDSSPPPKNTQVPFTGAGNRLDSKSTEIEQFKSIQEQVRNSWKKRFESSDKTKTNNSRIETPVQSSTTQSSSSNWEEVDSDVFIMPTRPDEVIVLDDSDNESDEEFMEYVKQIESLSNNNLTASERRNQVRNEIMEEASSSDESIEMIDGEYDDAVAVDDGRLDDALIAEFMSDDSLMKEYNDRNGITKTTDPNFDFVTCPICHCSLVRSTLSDHMEEGCLGIRIHLEHPKFDISSLTGGNKKSPTKRKKVSPPVTSRTTNTSSVPETRYACPNCGVRYTEERMHQHLDNCLS